MQQPNSGTQQILQTRWEILGELEQGVMSTSYLARDLRRANRKCVVEKLRNDFSSQEDTEKAMLFFQRKAFVLSQPHANIVPVIDYFAENEDYFLITEYVEGENLHQLMQRQAEHLSESQISAWMQQIAGVLYYLHSQEPPVICGNLKLSDIVIDSVGQVKVKVLVLE